MNTPETQTSPEQPHAAATEIPDIPDQSTKPDLTAGKGRDPSTTTIAKPIVRNDVDELKNLLIGWINHYAGGFTSGIILATLSYFSKKTNVAWLQILYSEFGKDFLHHYASFPLALFYFMVFATGLSMMFNELISTWVRKNIIGSLNSFIFHLCSISSGVLFVNLVLKQFDYIDESADLAWTAITISLMFVVPIVFSLMLHYLTKTVDEVAGLRTSNLEDKIKYKRYSIVLLVLTTILVMVGWSALSSFRA